MYIPFIIKFTIQNLLNY